MRVTTVTEATAGFSFLPRQRNLDPVYRVEHWKPLARHASSRTIGGIELFAASKTNNKTEREHNEWQA